MISTMARAKRKADPVPAPIRRSIVNIRGTEAWRDWLVSYATFRRVPVAVVIDLALAEAAKRDNFEPPPER